MQILEYIRIPVGGINWGMKPTGGDIFGPRQRYLRTRTEISLDKSGDIRPQAKPYNGPTDKVHIGYNSSNGYTYIFRSPFEYNFFISFSDSCISNTHS